MLIITITISIAIMFANMFAIIIISSSSSIISCMIIT